LVKLINKQTPTFFSPAQVRDGPLHFKKMESEAGGAHGGRGHVVHQLNQRAMLSMVGGASALVTFICVPCILRTPISRSMCNFTHYINTNNNNNLTINMQLHTL
jgi:hypothetical protein